MKISDSSIRNLIRIQRVVFFRVFFVHTFRTVRSTFSRSVCVVALHGSAQRDGAHAACSTCKKQLGGDVVISRDDSRGRGGRFSGSPSRRELWFAGEKWLRWPNVGRTRIRTRVQPAGMAGMYAHPYSCIHRGSPASVYRTSMIEWSHAG